MRIFLLVIFYLFSCQKTDFTNEKKALFKLEQNRSHNVLDFEPYLKSNNAIIQLLAIESISKIQDSVFIDVLKPFCKDANATLKKAAIFAISQIQHPSIESFLIDCYKENEIDSIFPFLIKALSKQSHQASIEQFKDAVLNNTYPEIGFDLGVAIRSNKNLKECFPIILDNWKNYNDDVKYSFAYYFSRLDTMTITKNDSFFKTEYIKLNKLNSINAIMAQNDLLSTLNKSLLPAKEFIKNELNSSINWRLQMQLLNLTTKQKDFESFSIIGPIISNTNINSYVLDFFISNFIKFKINDSYWELIESLTSSKFLPIKVNKNLNSVSQIIKTNYLKSNIHEQKDMILAAVKSSDKMLISFIINNYDSVQSRVKTFLTEQLINDKNLYSDFFIARLEEADLARSNFAADYISKNKRHDLVPNLIRVYKKLTMPKDFETKDFILQKLNDLTSDSIKPFIVLENNKVLDPLLIKSFNTLLEKYKFNKLTAAENVLGYAYDENKVFGKQAKNLEIILNKGVLKLKLFYDKAPRTIANILELAEKGFYSNLSFHRVVPNFVVQGGDPRGDGWGGPGYNVRCEYTDLRFKRGSVGIATSGKDTGSSQFYIMQSYAPHLDGRYTVFAEVIEGLDLIDSINVDDEILSVNVIY